MHSCVTKKCWVSFLANQNCLKLAKILVYKKIPGTQYFFTKDGVLRFISAFVTITVFKTKSESAWIKTIASEWGSITK